MIQWLKVQGEQVSQYAGKLTCDFVVREDFSFLISYGYRHIISKDILDYFPNRAINLHISYLPWNRGSDPNFWSFVDGTPKGVTIHFMDEGIDTGDIIVQRQVELDVETETLRSSYNKLHDNLKELFKQHWPAIKSGTCSRTPQPRTGTSHRTDEKFPLFSCLTDGFDSEVSELIALAGNPPKSEADKDD